MELPALTPEYALLAAMMGIITALVAFALLVICGGALLRVLRIPADPLAGYRFQPPSPQPVPGPVDGQAARQRGVARRALEPRFARAQQAWVQWLQIKEALYILREQHPQVIAAGQLADWEAQADTAGRHLEALLPQLADGDDGLDQLCQEMQAVYDELDQVMAKLPAAASRRWLWVLLLLLLMSLWTLIVVMP